MTTNKPAWKLETIKELRKFKRSKKILHLLEVLYNTVIPVFTAYFILVYDLPFLILIIIFIMFVRLKIK